VCEADALIIAVACEAADYSPKFRENPEVFSKNLITGPFQGGESLSRRPAT
jgi:hypothetical protein